MTKGYFEIINTNVSTPYTTASNLDLVIRTDQLSQRLTIGNGSNVEPAISLSNNFVYMNQLYHVPIAWYSKNRTLQTVGANSLIRILFNSLGPSSLTTYFNNSSNGFVCPVAGYYQANVTMHIWNNGTATGQVTGGGFYRNNILYNSNVLHYLTTSSISGDNYLTVSDIIPLNINDILTVQFNFVNLQTGNQNRNNVFYGNLIFPT